jgi:hypothetical protein
LLEKKNKGGNTKEFTTNRPMGKESMLKGAIHRGLEKDFPPLKTRSARKLGSEKLICDSSCTTVVDGLRALRAQKSLTRVKK